jgi:hypothetical protein
MKTTIATLLIIFLAGCSKDSAPKEPVAQLPPATQTGANTFGVVINNQVFYPRDGSGNLGGSKPSKGIIFWGESSGNELYNEIDCGNYNGGKPANNMIIHLQSLNKIGAGDYVLDTSNFQHLSWGLLQNYIYCLVYEPSLNGWRYYSSYENSGKVTITRYDLPNRIVSGVFSGKLRLKDGAEEIEVINGRFDIKWSTLDQTPFP